MDGWFYVADIVYAVDAVDAGIQQCERLVKRQEEWYVVLRCVALRFRQRYEVFRFLCFEYELMVSFVRCPYVHRVGGIPIGRLY